MFYLGVFLYEVFLFYAITGLVNMIAERRYFPLAFWTVFILTAIISIFMLPYICSVNVFFYWLTLGVISLSVLVGVIISDNNLCG